MIYRITVSLLFIILKFFYHLRIQGVENIPKKGAFILASNHVSYFDPPILAVGCFMIRPKLNFIAKEELFCNKAFGWYIKKLGAFPIKRDFGDIGAIKESIRRIKRGEPLVIFPEGERSPNGEIKESFPGIALLSVKTKIPIIPAFIEGSNNVLSESSKKMRLCKLSLRIGKPLVFYNGGPQTYSGIADKIMSAIKDLSNNS